jgi:hypothetical protein
MRGSSGSEKQPTLPSAAADQEASWIRPVVGDGEMRRDNTRVMRDTALFCDGVCAIGQPGRFLNRSKD